MVLINEWLPNPTGSDVSGEWIELFNSGTATVNLSGWTIKNSGKGKFVFKNQTISANQYLVLPRSETKLALKNTDEKIFLYDANGRLVNQSGFLGTAQEGKSFSRSGTTFSFANSTPGAANAAPLQTAIVSENIAFNKPLHVNMGTGTVIGLTFIFGLLFSIGAVYLIMHDEALSKFLFPRD